jgi:hypothetical protein
MIVTNMLFFGVLNIPLFKYFCDVPTFNALYLVDEDLFFYKNYFSCIDNISLFNSFFFMFSIDFNFFFYFLMIFIFLYFYFYHNLHMIFFILLLII